VHPLADQDYYEILEVPRNGTPAQVDRAYRIAIATYRPLSMATYSIFSDEESRTILGRIEEAYTVLSDRRRRWEYDQQLARCTRGPVGARGAAEPPVRPQAEAASRTAAEAVVRGPCVANEPQAEPVVPGRESRVGAAVEGWFDAEEGIDEVPGSEDGMYDGGVLRRIRMSRGIDLEQVAATTKVNPHYLACIEEERFDSLPPPVYVRGFVTAFANLLGLDGPAVARSYVARMQPDARRGA
jgi:curved DNA-binding protein CbpA